MSDENFDMVDDMGDFSAAHALPAVYAEAKSDSVEMLSESTQ